jgi:spore germination cell wall hydrolase CwlJ-like protein
MLTVIAFLLHFSLVGVSPREVNCVAEAVYYEARGEPIEGRIAVANVVMNRMRSSGHTACSVIWKARQFAWVGVRKPITDKEAWSDAVEIAALVYTGLITDQVDGATHFVTRAEANYLPWFEGYRLGLLIGNHIFLIPRGSSS